MRTLTKLVLAAVLFMGLATSANAVPIFVGSWQVADGPIWSPNGSKDILTAQDAAAIVFGGSAADYIISTVDSNPLNIDFMAWYSVWGGPAQIFAQDFSADTGIIGKYDTPGDTSAYIQDHCGIQPGVDANVCRNFAFIDVPEPGIISLLGAGLVVAGFVGRKRRSLAHRSA
jgi:hypothetical protein